MVDRPRALRSDGVPGNMESRIPEPSMGQIRAPGVDGSDPPEPHSQGHEGRKSQVRPSPERRAPPDLPPRFRMVGLLGLGGMGAVYDVLDQSLGHNVALKCLYDVGPADRYRLKKEFRTLANIVHPNLVNLYELFVHDAFCFFTMERVAGLDFVSDARRAATEDPGAFLSHFCSRARQLALAIAALHRAEALHRDVKPSNVLVTASGRVVLLDFGLSMPLSDLGNASGFMGTLEYMAPEQQWGDPLTPATDWYSFGLTLYEALAGVLPFRGAPFEMASQKRAGKIIPIKESSPNLPDDLDQLVTRLLHPLPLERPGALEVLRCLGAGTPEGPVRIEAPATSIRPMHLVSRTQELALLHHALEDVRGGARRIVHVHGPSGIGKTELLRSIATAPGDGARLILRGRCHPQESIRFNALDGAIDDLTRALQQMTPEELSEIAPKDPEPLVRVFPVLGSIPALLGWSMSGEEASLAQLRRRAFDGLKELLGRLCERREVVLCIDDLQWGDVDSGLLLRELLRGPKSPRLLTVFAYRSEDRESSECLRVLAEEPEVAQGSGTVFIELGPLDSDESMQLVKHLSGLRSREGELELEQLTREAGGSPFFLGEIGRYLADREPQDGVPRALGLRDILLARTSRLSPAGHLLLELIAVAGGPVEQDVLLSAARLPHAEKTTLTVLERLAMVRTSATESRAAEVYHHRIRDELLSVLPAETRRMHHRALADALLTSADPKPHQLVEHYLAAGELDGARRYVVTAAAQATTALAFDRAAQLYQRAIDLGSTELETSELHARLGHALANAERARDAGRAFERAAKLLEFGASFDPARLLFLQRNAAEQFLKSGHDREGVDAFSVILEKLQIDYPKTRSEALRKALALRLRGLFRQRMPRARDAAEISRGALDRAEALYTIATTLGIVDHTRSNYMSALGFLAALDSGDPAVLIRASAAEAACWGAIPWPLAQKRAASLLRYADDLILRHKPGAMERGSVFVAKATLAWLRAEWAETASHADAAVASFQSHGRGVSFDIAMAYNWGLAALALGGELKLLVSRVLALVDDAEQREDRFLARISSLGQPSLAWLALDRPEYARERAARAIAWWPEDDYRLQHYQHYIATAQALMYEGNGTDAHRATVEHWPKLAANHFLLVPCARDELAHLRARTALAAAAQLDPTARRRERERLLLLAEGSVRPLTRHGLDAGKAWACLISASVESLREQPAEAAASFRRAIVECDRARMAHYREAARYCLGALDGTDGRAHVDRAVSWFESEGVKNPRAMVRMLVPGCIRG
jgi:hypothetical protein